MVMGFQIPKHFELVAARLPVEFLIFMIE